MSPHRVLQIPCPNGCGRVLRWQRGGHDDQGNEVYRCPGCRGHWSVVPDRPKLRLLRGGRA